MAVASVTLFGTCVWLMEKGTGTPGVEGHPMCGRFAFYSPHEA